MKGFFSNLRTRVAECQMALQYEEDISPSLMLQERKGNPINSQEKKDFFLVSLLQKKGSVGKKERKSWVDFWDGSSEENVHSLG